MRVKDCSSCTKLNCVFGKCDYYKKKLSTLPESIPNQLRERGNAIISVKRLKCLGGENKITEMLHKKLVFADILFRKITDYYVIEVW